MNRSSMNTRKSSESYKRSVDEFLSFASQNLPEDGKMNCPCNLCKNLTKLKRRIVRRHLLRYGFDRDYTQWISHGEIDPIACSTVESSESTEKNDGDVDRGNDSKSTVGIDRDYTQWVCHGEIDPIASFTVESSESTEKNDGDVDRGNDSKSTEEPGDSVGVLPKPSKGAGKDILMLDEESDHTKVLATRQALDLGLDGEKISEIAGLLLQRPENVKLKVFAHSLYMLMKNFGWSRESFDKLISCLTTVFPLLERLPKCFNSVWHAYDFDGFDASNGDGGHCSSLESIAEHLDERPERCYACGDDLNSEASTSTSTSTSTSNSASRKSKNKRRNKRR